MNLAVVFVIILALTGGWALITTGRFLNVRQTQPSLLSLVRGLFFLSVFVLLLIYIGTIPNTISKF